MATSDMNAGAAVTPQRLEESQDNVNGFSRNTRSGRRLSSTLVTGEQAKSEERHNESSSEKQIIVAWNLDDPENPYNWSKVSLQR